MVTKTLLITQARTGSTRFPGKILKVTHGKTLLQIHLERIKKCTSADLIVVATTTKKEDVIISEACMQWGFATYSGSEDDVLDRFYQAAKPFDPEWVIRVTSDCPLLDPVLIDEVVNYVQQQNADYGTNTLIEHYPDGQDVEVMKFSALERAWREAVLKSEREHVTPYMINNAAGLFKVVNYPCENDFSRIRMTVDEPKDFELIDRLIAELGTDKTWKEYTDFITTHNLGMINAGIIRNEGYLRSLENDSGPQ
jgi:spore coat polysaccharide biosynthesis protein SpsF